MKKQIGILHTGTRGATWKTSITEHKCRDTHSESKGDAPQYQWIQNYIQFVLLVFEDNNTPTLREQYLGEENRL